MKNTQTVKTEVAETLTGEAFRIKNSFLMGYYIPLMNEEPARMVYCTESAVVLIDEPVEGDELEPCSLEEAYKVLDKTAHKIAVAVHHAFCLLHEEGKE